MQQTTHCTGVMPTAMIQQELKAGCCQISVEYWKMYRHVYTMYIHICKIPVYVHEMDRNYIFVQTRMYKYIFLCNMYIPSIYRFTFLYMNKHVCPWFRHVCTVLPNPVQVVRIPDGAGPQWQRPGPQPGHRDCDSRRPGR